MPYLLTFLSSINFTILVPVILKLSSGYNKFSIGITLITFLFGSSIGCSQKIIHPDKVKNPIEQYFFAEVGFLSYIFFLQVSIGLIYLLHLKIPNHTIGPIITALAIIPPSIIVGFKFTMISKLYDNHLKYRGEKIGTLFSVGMFGVTLGVFQNNNRGSYFSIPTAIYFLVLFSLTIAWLTRRLSVKWEESGEGIMSAIRHIMEKPVPPPIFRGSNSIYLLSVISFGISVMTFVTAKVFWCQIATPRTSFKMFAAFTFGLSIGAFLSTLFVDQLRKNVINFFGLLVVLIGLMTALSVPMANVVRDNSIFFRWSMLTISVIPMGVAFPLVVRIYAKNRERFAISIGEIYSIGAISAAIGWIMAGSTLRSYFTISMNFLLVAMAMLSTTLGCLVILKNKRR